MKKGLVVVLLIIIASVFCVNTMSFAYADTQDCYYSASDNITCYKTADPTTPIVVIPKTYYFKITGSSEDYYTISYNNETMYATRSDIDTKSKLTDLTSITNPYYNMTLVAPETKIKVYGTNDYSFSDGTDMTIYSINFIGYYYNQQNSTYYFYVKLSTNLYNDENNFIEANSITTNFTASNIPLHPNSSEAKEQEKQEAGKRAENNLKRNVFFFSICTLCVVVVVLIYNPFKKKGASSAPSSNSSSEDDF